MSEKMKATAAALRLYIAGLRGVVNKNVSSRGYEARTARRNAHEQLKLLAPLYRALAALTQQVGMPDSKGGARYKACFRRICEEMHREFPYWGTNELRQFEGMQGVCVLVPQDEVSASEWPQATMADVFSIVRQEIAAAQALRTRQQRHASATRTDFIESLSIGQLALLNEALQAAREAGCHAVSFSDKDLC